MESHVDILLNRIVTFATLPRKNVDVKMLYNFILDHTCEKGMGMAFLVVN